MIRRPRWSSFWVLLGSILILCVQSNIQAMVADSTTSRTLYCFEGSTVLPFVLEWSDGKPPVMELPGFLPHRKDKGYRIESMSPLQKGEFDLGIRTSGKNTPRELVLHVVVVEARIENLDDIESRLQTLYFGSTLHIEAQTADSNHIPEEQFVTKFTIDSGTVKEVRGRKIELPLDENIRSIEYSSLVWENPVNKERIELLAEAIAGNIQQAPPQIITSGTIQSPVLLPTREERKDFQMKINVENIRIESSVKAKTSVDILDVQAGIQKADVPGYIVKCEGIQRKENGYQVTIILIGPQPKKTKVEGTVTAYIKARAKNKRNGVLSSFATGLCTVPVGY